MEKMRSISEERNDLMEKVLNSDSEIMALKYLHELRENYDWAIPGYRNSLKIFSDTTYENRKHFLLELIQNADDAKFKNTPEITFEIKDKTFVIRYNENGFTKSDVIAITDTGNSTKKIINLMQIVLLVKKE